MSTAGMNSRQRKQVVEHICNRAMTLSTGVWGINSDMVWRNFAGRRGGFDAKDVVDFLTLSDFTPSMLRNTGEDLRLREMLRSEIDGGELWMPKRKRARVAYQPFDPRDLIRRAAGDNVLLPAIIDGDEDADFALAVQLSLDDERARQAIEAPVSPAQHIMEEDDIIAFDYLAPREASNDAVACLLCLDVKPVLRVTQCCKHKYCIDCIRNTFKHAEGLPRCPDCVANGQPPVTASNGICADARMNIDPFCVKAADPDLCHSRHLAPFLNTFNCSKFTAVCPVCETTTYGSAILDDDNCCRCPNVKCALLFCRACAQPYHGYMKCKARILPADTTYMANNVRKCPVCSERIQHFRNHGCHHVTCPSCATALCSACGMTKQACETQPFRRRCPIFCNDRCNCPDCGECRPGHKCSTCSGCTVCGFT